MNDHGEGRRIIVWELTVGAGGRGETGEKGVGGGIRTTAIEKR